MRIRRLGTYTPVIYSWLVIYIMKKEQIRKNSWEFHLTDKIAHLSEITLEMHTEFWLSSFRIWFRGYQTPEELKAKIFGREVDLSISIAPLGTPTETLPVVEEKLTKSKKVLLPPKQQTYLDTLKRKIKALKKLLPPKVDEVLEQRCLDDMNADRLKEIIQYSTGIWSNPNLSVEEKLNQLIPYKIELYDLVCLIQLPDELMRADTNISIIMATIQFFAESVEKNAKKHKIKTPRQVHQLVKFTDKLITRMNEGQNKLNGVERDMTKKEFDAYLKLEYEAGSARRPLEERLKLYEQLWEMPSVSTNCKIKFMNEAIKLVKKQYCKNPEFLCPHESLIRKHLGAISGYLNELEEEGEAAWQLHMADELLSTANVWREDCELPPLSKEEFASQIALQSVHIKTKELEEGAIHYELELFFQDTADTFAGHFLYADMEDHEVKEIMLMG